LRNHIEMRNRRKLICTLPSQTACEVAAVPDRRNPMKISARNRIKGTIVNQH